MKTLIAVVLLLVVAGAAVYYVSGTRQQEQMRQAEAQAAHGAARLANNFKERVKDFHLSAPEIRDELARTGQIVRNKAGQVGAALADATADARITGAIKAKLVKDPNLSALSVSVSTTSGVVTLSGSVNSPDDIGRAMQLALETDGVRQVISTLQVRADKGQPDVKSSVGK